MHRKIPWNPCFPACSRSPPSFRRDLALRLSLRMRSADEVPSPGLRQVRRQIQQQPTASRGQLGTGSSTGSARYALQDAVVTQRNGRFCLPVKAEYRGQVPGMIQPISPPAGSDAFY